ncbi:MAG: lycopene cyclase domain-containing protein [bacterium]|nr:lycopene cyclase domain-containing protein [bacterium]
MNYLFIIIIFGCIPSLLFLYLSRAKINWRAFLYIEMAVFVIAVVTDYIGIYNKIWVYSFGNEKTLGVNFLTIPFEDYLFFLTIPPWIIGGYEFMRKSKSTALTPKSI